ncbi:hypothetical protein [Ciceribacter selenitireducens]
MVLRSDGMVLNTVIVTKFGLPVARTVVAFEKTGGAKGKVRSR